MNQFWQEEKHLLVRIWVQDALIHCAVFMLGFAVAGSLFALDRIFR